MRIFPISLLSATAAPAAIVLTPAFEVNAVIPDNSALGLADTRMVVTAVDRIERLRVSIEVTGGWNGDFYAHLVHGSGFSVLLNRMGRTAADTIGSGTSGLNATFDDAALSDIHLASPFFGPVTGFHQPDARRGDPSLALDTSPRTAWLTTFNGIDPNGSWTLFIADLAAGSTGTLTRWSLEITGIPEPSSPLLAGMALTLLSGRRRGPPCGG